MDVCLYKKYKKYKKLYKTTLEDQEAGALSDKVKEKARQSRVRRLAKEGPLNTRDATAVSEPDTQDASHLGYSDLIQFIQTINRSPIYSRGELSKSNNRLPITFKSHSIKISSTWESVVASRDVTINNKSIVGDEGIKEVLRDLISEQTWSNMILKNVILLSNIIMEDDVLDTLNESAFGENNVKLFNGKECVKLSPRLIAQQNIMIYKWLQGELCTSIELEIGFDVGLAVPSANPWHTDGTCRFFINYPKETDNPNLTKEDYGLTQYINHPEVPDNLSELISKARSDDLPEIYYNTHIDNDRHHNKRHTTLQFLQDIAMDPENVKETEIEKWEFHWPDLFMKNNKGDIIHIPGRWHQKNPSRLTSCSIKRVYGRLDFPMLTIGKSKNSNYYRLLEHSAEKLGDSDTWRERHEGAKRRVKKVLPSHQLSVDSQSRNTDMLPPHLLTQLYGHGR